MNIDYNWKEPAMKKVHGLSGFINWFRHKPVPNCHSDHYNKEHFDPNAPPKLF